MDNGEQSYSRFLSGDDYGMVELIRDYKDDLILYINNYVNNVDTAEDIVQETFIKLAVKKPRFNGKSSFKTWLFSIARNMAYDYIRKESRHRNVSFNDCNELESKNDIELDCLLEERKRMLYSVLRTLKTEYRQVIYLAYFEDFDNSEIAEIMHKSKRQIENLLYNAKKSLKSELERCGFHYEEL